MRRPVPAADCVTERETSHHRQQGIAQVRDDYRAGYVSYGAVHLAMHGPELVGVDDQCAGGARGREHRPNSGRKSMGDDASLVIE